VTGVRVVLDARALQDPDRAPTTSAYLDGLLTGVADQPLDGESFSLVLDSDHSDPSDRLRGVPIAARRLLPPTRLLRSAAVAIDPFLIRAAVAGSGWRADRTGAGGVVYHGVGPSLPIASSMPVVVTLLDLAPWELPDRYAASGPARFGHRVRRQVIRDADAVLVGTEAVARLARRHLRVRPERLHVIRFAPRPAFAEVGIQQDRARVRDDARRERQRLGLSERYLVHAGRFDARHDTVTLLKALAALAAAGRPSGLDAAETWPPRICVVGATPADRAAIARVTVREGVSDFVVYAPALPEDRLAALVAGARAVVLAVLTDAAGLAAIDASAAAVPVVASAVDGLAEIVGPAGVLVEPGEVDRLATAIATVWSNDEVHAGLVSAARDRLGEAPRTWGDVTAETRAVWSRVARPGRLR
jgi:glycosyltransferase involved in cell wall biosynthesis